MTKVYWPEDNGKKASFSDSSSSGGVYWPEDGKRPSKKKGKYDAYYSMIAEARGKKGGRGLGGFLGNLARDAEEAVVGLPGGVADLGQGAWDLYGGTIKRDRKQQARGLETGGKIADSYAYTYGPLFERDFGEFGSRVYEHPLGPILDAASVATGGFGAASRVGLLGKAARTVELRSPAVLAGQGGKTVSKVVSGGELSRRLRIGADKALKRLPPEFRGLGENARYSRAVKVEGIKGKLGKELASGRYQQAVKKLKGKDLVAFNLLHEFPTRSLLDSEIARLSKIKGAEAQVRALSDPEVLALIDAPSEKILRALDESKHLDAKQLDLLLSGEVKRGKKGNRPVLTKEAAFERRYQPALIARGAKKKGDNLIAPEGTTISEMIEQIRLEIAEAGRHEPLYRPQKSVEDGRGAKVGVGGTAAQNSPVKNNRGILQTLGRVAYDIDTLTPAYQRTVKWAVYTDRHQDLVDSAIRHTPNDASRLVASGKYEYVKRHRNEKISYTERTGAEFEQHLEEMFPEADDFSGGAEDLVTRNADEAATDAQGNRLVIPSNVRSRIVGEYVRSSGVYKALWERPTAVWRALVLNTNPAWLTHNIVGNTFLYAIQNAGPSGLKAYLQAVTDTLGPKVANKLLRDPAVRKRLTTDDVVELMPEQAAGTFFGTQNPRLAKGILNAPIRAVQGVTKPLREADVRYEQALRRAMINKLIRQSPEFRSVYKAMPKETREFRSAARKALSENKELNARISQKVNDTLGNYLGMSNFEQGFLRATMPFYAWFKAISIVTLKLVVDTPARADLLSKLGAVGFGDSVAQLGPDEIENYLRSIILTSEPGETPRGLQAQGFNPFMTETQLADALTSNDALLGLANPFLSGAIKTIGDTQDEGLVGGLLGLPRNVGSEILSNLPQSRLYDEFRGKKPGPHATYGDQSEWEALAAFLGFPMKTINVSNARANYRKYHGR